MSVFKGAGVAIATPFNKDKSVNFDDLEKLIEFQINNKTDALIVCGTTGEAATLTDEEQIECIRFAVEKVNKRIPVLAGAGSNHTSHGVELSVLAEKAGADGLLSVTPYYNKTTQAGLINHFKTIAASVSIPVILYNVPSRTGLNLVPKTLYELSKVQNIVGVKEASGDLSQVAQIAEMCGPDFDIYSGNDDQILPLLSLGGVGVVSVASNIIPAQIHDMVINFLDGNVKAAIELQLKYLRVINALFYEVNPIPVKAALELMGLSKAYYREPLIEMGSANLEMLKKEMQAVCIIK